MRARALEGRYGWLWIIEGWTLFRRQPLQLATLVMTYFLVVVGAWLILQGKGILGSLLAFALTLFLPGLSVGFLEGARHAEAGRPVYPNLLIRAFTTSQRTTLALLALGAIQIIALNLLFLLLASQLLDLPEGADGRVELPELSQANGGAFVRFYATSLCSTVSVSLLLWYAPVLISWHGLTPIKAIFFSVATLWRNRWAFAVYVAAWTGLLIILPFAAMMMMHAAGLDQLAFLVLLPLAIILTGTLYCSHYATYRTVFAADPPQT